MSPILIITFVFIGAILIGGIALLVLAFGGKKKDKEGNVIQKTKTKKQKEAEAVEAAEASVFLDPEDSVIVHTENTRRKSKVWVDKFNLD